MSAQTLRNNSAVLMSFCVLGILLSAWVSFSLPERGMAGVGSSLDIIAVGKLFVRVAILGLVAWIFLDLYWLRESRAQFLRFSVDGANDARFPHRSSQEGHSESWTSTRSRSTQLIVAATPWIAFLGWAGLSVLWSPLRSVSVGQAFGLASMFGLMWLIVITTDTPEKRESIVLTLEWMLGAFSGVVALLHLAAPDLSGLARDIEREGSIGVIHPTAAGAAASLGAVFGIGICLRQISSRRRALASFFVFVHVGVLLMAQSRSALGSCAIVVGILLTWKMPIGRKGQWLCFLGALLTAFVVFDPGFLILQDTIDSAFEFLARGQSKEELEEVSGRFEMWSAVWEEFGKAVLTGHGYFVTSESGELDVWYEAKNYTAHNIYLQLLVTTGLIGTALFMVGGLSLMLLVFKGLKNIPLREQSETDQFIFAISIVLAIWYLIWTVNCVSFIGPIRPESVMFFATVALLISANIPADLQVKTGSDYSDSLDRGLYPRDFDKVIS